MESIVLREESITGEHLDTQRSESTQPTPNHNAWDSALPAAPRGSDENCWRRICLKGDGWLPGARLRRGLGWVLVSVLIPALIISALRTICRASASASTNGRAGASTRRLSDSSESSHDDTSLSQLIEECVAMEEDLGLSLPREINVAEELDESEQVKRIALALYQESLVFEQQALQSQQELHPNIVPLTASSSISEIHDQDQNVQGEVNMTGAELAAGSPQSIHTDSTTSERQPGVTPPEPSASSTEPVGGGAQPVHSRTKPPLLVLSPFLVTPHGAFAILERSDSSSQSRAGRQPRVVGHQSVGLRSQAAASLPQNTAQRIPRKRSYLEGPKGASPAVDPDSWLNDAPVKDSSAERQGESQASSQNLRSPGQGSPCSSAPCKSPSGETESGGAGQSSSTASAGGAGAASAAAAADAAHEAAAATGLPEILTSRLHVNWISLHPYVHLPVLQKGVVVPLIRLSPSDFQSTKNEPVLEILLLIRQLLIKKELNQADTALLATNVQQLAIKSAARARATRGMNHPAHVVSNIGQHFLALDAVVSALQVLRKSPPSSPWWEAFTESFGKSDQYLGILVTREGGKGRIDLTNRLLAAISIYKTGSRPELSEIVELKRLLFFSSFAPLSFKTSGWDPWRSAHLLFEREYPMFSEWLRRQRQPLH